ncbi:DUF134 domain-containing protein [Sulfurospirillum sp. 1307]|jgi:predicted DNA-binding protein (UPF0251 family)
MKCCGRKRKSRNIDANHEEICFKPCGIKGDELESITIYDDEMEALRLADFESLYQQDCADKMNISRTTFSRLVVSARKKVTDALLNQKLLKVESR